MAEAPHRRSCCDRGSRASSPPAAGAASSMRARARRRRTAAQHHQALTLGGARRGGRGHAAAEGQGQEGSQARHGLQLCGDCWTRGEGRAGKEELCAAWRETMEGGRGAAPPVGHAAQGAPQISELTQEALPPLAALSGVRVRRPLTRTLPPRSPERPPEALKRRAGPDAPLFARWPLQGPLH